MDFTANLETAMRHFHRTGAFLTVRSPQGVNTMTISWGFIGFMWDRPYFITVTRPQRYTRELIGDATSFTVSLPFGTMAEELRVCGSQSGRDINKAEIVRFADARQVDSPVVAGCGQYYECRINYEAPLAEDSLPSFIREGFYKGDYHTLFFGEIVDCYGKQDE